MLIVRPPSEDDEERPPMPRLLEPGGYAVPRRPIHVILALSECATIQTETSVTACLLVSHPFCTISNNSGFI